jgi:hypothetical protein
VYLVKVLVAGLERRVVVDGSMSSAFLSSLQTCLEQAKKYKERRRKRKTLTGLLVLVVLVK